MGDHISLFGHQPRAILTQMAMDISAFMLIARAFEVRYEPAYEIWDISGEVWRNASRTWPTLKSTEAKPNVQAFRIDNRFELRVQLDHANIVTSGTKQDLDEFTKICDFFNSLFQSIKIKSFSRIGLRHTWARRFPTIEAAEEAFRQLNLINFPKEKLFSVEPKPGPAEISFRAEGDKLGYWLKVFTRKQTIQMETPFGENDIDTPEVVRNELVLDCDYYVPSDTKAGQFNASEWVRQAAQVARRGCNTFLAR